MGHEVESALTEDAFLGGRLRLLQPAQGYRAGVDPVLLAASVPAMLGQRVLELGCGVGAALLCLGRRGTGAVSDWCRNPATLCGLCPPQRAGQWY